MSTILYTGSFGSDDPTRATLPFIAALGAVEAGHQAQITLLGEATYLMKDTIAEHVQAVGLPALRELLPKVIEHGIPVYV